MTDIIANKTTAVNYLQKIGTDPTPDDALDLLADDAQSFLLSTREWLAKDDFAALLRAARSLQIFREPLRIDIHDITAEDNRVSVRCEGRAVIRNGASYHDLYHVLFEFDAAGQIRRKWLFNDTRHVFDLLRNRSDGSLKVKEAEEGARNSSPSFTEKTVSSCTGSETVAQDKATLENNKAVSERFHAAITRGDFEAVAALMADDYRHFFVSTRSWMSREEFLALEKNAGIGAGIFSKPLEIHTEYMTAEDNRVSVLSRGHAVTRDGLSYDQMYHELLRIDDGKIVELWDFNDTQHIFDVIRRGPGGTVGLPVST